MNKTKVIVWAIAIALLLIAGLACGPKQTETPPSPTPVTEPTTIPETPAPSPEAVSPADNLTEISTSYTTYTNESNLFSISYPSDWENVLPLMPDLENQAKKTESDLKAGLPVERTTILFIAGKPEGTGLDPNVNVGIEPVPATVLSNEDYADEAARALKKFAPDYHELSRINTKIDGRDAVIIEYEATYPGTGSKVHTLAMSILMGKTAWLVDCATGTEEFDTWKTDFDTIIRSLKIYD